MAPFSGDQFTACAKPDNRQQGRCRCQANRLNEASYAPVAQLDRALPSEGKGHTFESCRVRHFTTSSGELAQARAKTADLELKIGKKRSIFLQSLARLGGRGSARLNRTRLTEVIEVTTASDAGEVDTRHFSKLASVSRASYYRRFEARAPREAGVELTSHIQLLSLRHKFYGYRRITAVLRRSGINAKLVQRLIREDTMRRKPLAPR